MSNENKLNVYILTYNRADYLKQAVQSALDQTLRDFDLYVLDNASTDHTQEIMAGFSDPRLHYIRHERNIGGAGNALFARNHNQKEYYVAFHDDDIMRPDFLSKELAFLEANPKCAIAACRFDETDSEGNITKTYHPFGDEVTVYKGDELFRDYLGKRTFLCFPSIMYRDAFRREHDIVGKEEAGPSSDVIFYCDFCKHGGEIAVINEALIASRHHKGQDSFVNHTSMTEQLFRYMWNDPYYSELLMRYEKERQSFYGYQAYVEAIYLAEGKVDAQTARNDEEIYWQSIRGNERDRARFNRFMAFAERCPWAVKPAYNCWQLVKNTAKKILRRK